MSRHLLLVSNSTEHGRGYLDHVEARLRSLLGAVRTALFVPFALFDRDAYAAKAAARLAAMGIALESIHRDADPGARIAGAEAIFVGGGNTFRLLHALHELDLIAPIRRRVAEGAPYVGSSAGSIVACPTLKTTKDMPILQPRSFDALGLVPFQISPHYLDPDPSSRHMGETQEERILQFLEENDRPVIGLREGAFLVVNGSATLLDGSAPARIFRRGRPPLEAAPGSRLDFLLEESP